MKIIVNRPERSPIILSPVGGGEQVVVPAGKSEVPDELGVQLCRRRDVEPDGKAAEKTLSAHLEEFDNPPADADDDTPDEGTET